MGKMAFHDNVATNTAYGFNVDSLENDGVRIQNTESSTQEYGSCRRRGTLQAILKSRQHYQINMKSVPAVLFQGNVTNRASREIPSSPIPRRARISGPIVTRAVGTRETATLHQVVTGNGR